MNQKINAFRKVCKTKNLKNYKHFRHIKHLTNEIQYKNYPKPMKIKYKEHKIKKNSSKEVNHHNN